MWRAFGCAPLRAARPREAGQGRRRLRTKGMVRTLFPFRLPTARYAIVGE